jgi:fructuronate reductase
MTMRRMTGAAPLTLHRSDGRPAAPVRHVHLGLGAFFRAHLAWYTEQAPDRSEWGIAAFTGRFPRLAERLAAQDCLYTLVTRGPEADADAVISSLSGAHAADDADSWRRYLAAPATAIVSLTVTEAGYRRAPSGGLDVDDEEVRSDLACWRAGAAERAHTVPARLARGFAMRREGDAGPIALMSCDNLPRNGTLALRVAVEFAAEVDHRLAEWMSDHVHPIDTLVDRITPRTTAADIAELRDRTGREDGCPVVTEPYSEWVLSDSFAEDRPDWPSAGARIVEDVAPYEQRKLWLLNGAHSLLAYAAPCRGHTTVAEAIGDPTVLTWVREWWEEAASYVALPAPETIAYCDALVERFGNGRIRHQLSQIAADGSQKLSVRVIPVLRSERAARRVPSGAVRMLGAWIAHLRGNGVAVSDPSLGHALVEIQSARIADATHHALDVLDPALTDDVELAAAVARAAAEFSRPATPPSRAKDVAS